MNPSLTNLSGPADEVAAHKVGLSALHRPCAIYKSIVCEGPITNVISFDDLVGECQYLCGKINAKRAFAVLRLTTVRAGKVLAVTEKSARGGI
jgi:hypothetical protein